MKLNRSISFILGLFLMLAAGPVLAKDTVEVAFIGPPYRGCFCHWCRGKELG